MVGILAQTMQIDVATSPNTLPSETPLDHLMEKGPHVFIESPLPIWRDAPSGCEDASPASPKT
jgi:hypothetical protein